MPVPSFGADSGRLGLIRQRLVRTSQRIVDFADRWFPDAYVFVLMAVIIAAAGAIVNGASPLAVSRAFGDGVWNLIPFTMQIALIAIGGSVVATSPPASVILRRIAAIPATGRTAVIWVGVLSILLSLINWGLSLIFSGLLVRQIARREDLRLDYRAAGAAAYLGLGCGFTLGITSSVAQLQANADSIPPSLLPITGVIAFSETILTWQNTLTIVVVTLLSAAICYCTTPDPAAAKTAAELGIGLGQDEVHVKSVRPGDYLERSPVLTILVVMLAAGWLWETFRAGNPLITLSGLNTYNLVFLLLGMLLQWRPVNFVRAFGRAMPGIAGVLLQFPFYAGVAQIVTTAKSEGGATLSDTIASWFVSASGSPEIFSVLVSIYSAILGFFVPSAGGKWVIEAPYIMTAANDVGAHLGWTVMVYNIAETLPNFLNPFWMLPLLGILGLRAKDLIGYTSIQFAVHLPLVIILAAVLMSTFTYHPPVQP